MICCLCGEDSSLEVCCQCIKMIAANPEAMKQVINIPMTPEQAQRQLIKCQEMDQELGHIEADRVLTKFLQWLGQNDVAEEYRKVRKWYA